MLYALLVGGKPPAESHALLPDSKDAEGKLAAEPLEPARAKKMLGCFAEPAGSSKTGSKDSSSSTQQWLPWAAARSSSSTWQHYRGVSSRHQLQVGTTHW